MPNQPIILLHGALGHALQLQPLRNALTEVGCEVHIVEFTGHGKTAPSACFGIETFAQELKTYIAENKLNNCHVFGYSMGGYVALWMAANHPGPIAKITTLATKYAWNPEQAKREAAMLDADAIMAKVPAFAESLQLAHGQRWRDLLTETRAMMLGLGDNPMLDPTVLSEVKITVEVLVGDLDRMVSQTESQELASALPNAQFGVLSGVKHPIEQVPVSILVEALLH